MVKNQFLDFLKENILTLFTGSEIIGEEYSSPRDNCIAKGDGGSIKIKYSKEDNYRIIIRRAQPFKTFEIHLIQTIINEIKKLNDIKIFKDYKRGIENMIIENAICKSLTNSSSDTISQVISEMTYWGQMTYEGNRRTFGCIVTKNKIGGKNTNPNSHISKALENDFSALITDGQNTFVEVSSDGYITGYVTIQKQIDDNLYAPYSQLKLALISTGAKIGLCLNEEGDLLIFKNKSLLFAKRSGKWICYTHEEIVDKLSEKAGDYEDVRKSIYLSALDTSFNRCGGCIVHVNSADLPNVLKHIDDADILDKESYDIIQKSRRQISLFSEIETFMNPIVEYEDFLKDEKCTKTANIRQLIMGKKFQNLDRNIRQKLIAIDGATVIGYDGTIIAIGAIIKIEAGSSGGGRLAAAKTLSNYGVSIKISNDGTMQGFKMDKNKLRAKTIFVL